MKFKISIKTCDKCKTKGNSDEIKTYAIMRHFPFYDYESFYLCDKCFEILEQEIARFFNIKVEQEKKVYCLKDLDEGFCSDNCNFKYNHEVLK